MGNALFKWLWDHYGDDSRVRTVPITPIDDPDRSFEEFPADPALSSFDVSDRKFVAVAVGSGLTPTVLNAADSDWWDFLAPLATHGVIIQHICGNPRVDART
jgi:hypothetical protein